MILQPRLVISAGMPAAGKTTTCEAIARKIANAVYLDRDTMISGGMLYVDSAKGDGLLPLRQYLGDEPATEIETPFGPMLLLGWDRGFYYRHVDLPSRLAIGRQAAQNLRLGNVPIFDCFLARDINNGAVGNFMSWEIFDGFPVRLLYFIVRPQLCRERMERRAEADEEARARTEILLNTFSSEIQQNHTLNADGEAFVREHGLMIDTTSYSTEEAVARCIEYIAS